MLDLKPSSLELRSTIAMSNTQHPLRFAFLLLFLSLLPYSAVAQTPVDDDLSTENSEALNVPGDAERLGVQEVGIQDFEFEQQTQPRRLKDIGLKRELDVKLVPPPNRQNTVYEDTEGVQVQIKPGKPKP
jgi:hypothetical protein